MLYSDLIPLFLINIPSVSTKDSTLLTYLPFIFNAWNITRIWTKEINLLLKEGNRCLSFRQLWLHDYIWMIKKYLKGHTLIFCLLLSVMPLEKHRGNMCALLLLRSGGGKVEDERCSVLAGFTAQPPKKAHKISWIAMPGMWKVYLPLPEGCSTNSKSKNSRSRSRH